MIAAFVTLVFTALTAWLVFAAGLNVPMAALAVLLGALALVVVLFGVVGLLAGNEDWPAVWNSFTHTVAKDFDWLVKCARPSRRRSRYIRK
ncbi:MAG: hypothetical protein M0Z73_06055 [Betaproteobacteria bacterium]|nr:hypothetical protein [Betaproteobacteria bacterium]